MDRDGNEGPPQAAAVSSSGTVLTLGILSIVFAGCFPAGIVLGYLGMTKGRRAIDAIEAGVLEKTERGVYTAGKVCGTIGLILSSLTLAYWVVWLFITMIVVVAGSAG